MCYSSKKDYNPSEFNSEISFELNYKAIIYKAVDKDVLINRVHMPNFKNKG